MNNTGIYGIENVFDGQIYVGQSKDVEHRLREHKKMLKKGNHHNIHLQRAWNKYGEEVFLFKILEECPVEKLDTQENFWIKKLHAAERGYGYNMEKFARGTGARSLETCLKISKTKKNEVRDLEKCAEWGRRSLGIKKSVPMSEEHRAKLASYTGSATSQFGTCWIHLGETNKKISQEDLSSYNELGWQTGRFIPQECKDRMLRGRTIPTKGLPLQLKEDVGSDAEDHTRDEAMDESEIEEPGTKSDDRHSAD